MIIQTNAVNDIWRKAYDHFRLRLNERYKIDVAFHEYVLLCKERVDTVRREPKTAVGYLTIRGVKVLVVKDTKRSRHLKTALVNNQLTPK